MASKRESKIDFCATPDLESASIYDMLARIGDRTRPLLLPAIQRRFVWYPNDICKLFDSILQGYPIGTFLFWEIEDERRHDYAFYEFIRGFSEHEDGCYNPTAERNLPSGVTGVLDGQQRLNSMLIALCGSYCQFIGGQGYHASRKSSYLERRLHIIVDANTSEESETPVRFKFLTREEADPSNSRGQPIWFPVDRIFHATHTDELIESWSRFLAGLPDERRTFQEVPPTLRLLRQRIHEENLIRYFPIRKRSLTEALDIFIRANNGGVQVTAAEMIFATIIAHWPEGRKAIEAFNRQINETGHGFGLDISRILLGILAVGGLSIQLKIESFNPDSVDQIRDRFEEIKNPLLAAAELMNEWGLSGSNATNPNALIALALLLNRGINAAASNEDLRQFVLRSLLCEIYRRPETSLRQIRSYAETRLHTGGSFDLSHFEQNFMLPSGKTLKIGEDLLEELLTVPISDRRAYIVLALVHPQHAKHQHQFHKDHLHPHAGFNDLTALNLAPEQAVQWHDMKNRLPNVQLLQGAANNFKRAKPLKAWIESEFSEDRAREVFLEQNDIPHDLSLELRDFDRFFAVRKESLRQRLKKLLNISAIESPLPALVDSN